MEDNIYSILESSNSTLLEAFKEDKKKRDVAKAKAHFNKYAKNSKKNPWLTFLDWKKEHPKLYWGLVIGLGLAGGVAFKAGLDSIGAAGAGFEKAAFNAVKIANGVGV